MVKWWDRFWGLVWIAGSIWIAYLTARWISDLERAAPADLGGLRYGLIGSAFIFGLLVGALLLSLLVIGFTTGLEWVAAKLGRPFDRPARATDDLQSTERRGSGDAPTATPPASDVVLAESATD